MSDQSLTDLTKYKAEKTRSQVDALEIGRIIYLHPKENAGAAVFGKFAELTKSYDGDQECLFLKGDISFEYVRTTGGQMWIPTSVSSDWSMGRLFPSRRVIEGRWRLYEGNEIKKGMEEHGNKNWSLVEEMIGRYEALDSETGEVDVLDNLHLEKSYRQGD